MTTLSLPSLADVARVTLAEAEAVRRQLRPVGLAEYVPMYHHGQARHLAELVRQRTRKRPVLGSSTVGTWLSRKVSV